MVYVAAAAERYRGVLEPLFNQLSGQAPAPTGNPAVDAAARAWTDYRQASSKTTIDRFADFAQMSFFFSVEPAGVMMGGALFPKTGSQMAQDMALYGDVKLDPAFAGLAPSGTLAMMAIHISNAAYSLKSAAESRTMVSQVWGALTGKDAAWPELVHRTARMGFERPTRGAKLLPKALQELGRRLGKLTQDEEVVLGELRKGRERRGRGGAVKDKDVAQHNDRHVGEVERDTLLLDDLIGQKRLEELLAISDEMSQLRDRMKQMLAEYGKHPSEALRKELERELRAFERRMAELIDKARAMQGELPDEFMNREALGQSDMQSRLDRLRDLISKGDVHKAQEELNRMSQALDGLVKGLEHGLRGFRRERFSAEEKALSELEGKVADLAHDQEELRQRTDAVRQSAAARTRQVLRDRVEALSKRLSADIQKLRKTLEGVDVAPLGPWGTDEMDKVQKRLDDLQRMVEQGDLDEAKAMASEAEQSLGRLEEEVRGEEQASRWGLKVRLSRSRAKLEQARPQARDIVNEIARALPRPEEVLSPAERQQLGELRAQEEALRKRVGELGRELGKRARESKDAPRLEQLAQEAPEGLRKATGFMEQSEGELKRLQPRGASSAQGQALEQLGQLRRDMQEARRPRNEGAGMRSEREPVKIPGVDEYRAPKEFRQDLLDAAKREAPSEYREQVRRYCDSSYSDPLRKVSDPAKVFTPNFLRIFQQAGKPEGRFEPWSCWLRYNNPATMDLPLARVPMLYVTGEKDVTVPASGNLKTVQRWCQEGMPIQYLSCSGADHTQVLVNAFDEVFNFFAARQQGKPLSNLCQFGAPVR